MHLLSIALTMALVPAALASKSERLREQEDIARHFSFSERHLDSLLDATVLEDVDVLRGMAMAKAGVPMDGVGEELPEEAKRAYLIFNIAQSAAQTPQNSTINDQEMEARLQRIVKKLLDVEDGSELAWSRLESALTESQFKNVPNLYEDAMSYGRSVLPGGLLDLAAFPDEIIIRALLVALKEPPYKLNDLPEEGRLAKLVFDALLRFDGDGDLMAVQVGTLGPLDDVLMSGPAFLRKAFNVALKRDDEDEQSFRVFVVAHVIEKIVQFKHSGAIRHAFLAENPKPDLPGKEKNVNVHTEKGMTGMSANSGQSDQDGKGDKKKKKKFIPKSDMKKALDSMRSKKGKIGKSKKAQDSTEKEVNGPKEKGKNETGDDSDQSEKEGKGNEKDKIYKNKNNKNKIVSKSDMKKASGSLTAKNGGKGKSKKAEGAMSKNEGEKGKDTKSKGVKGKIVPRSGMEAASKEFRVKANTTDNMDKAPDATERVVGNAESPIVIEGNAVGAALSASQQANESDKVNQNPVGEEAKQPRELGTAAAANGADAPNVIGDGAKTVDGQKEPLSATEKAKESKEVKDPAVGEGEKPELSAQVAEKILAEMEAELPFQEDVSRASSTGESRSAQLANALFNEIEEA